MGLRDPGCKSSGGKDTEENQQNLPADDLHVDQKATEMLADKALRLPALKEKIEKLRAFQPKQVKRTLSCCEQ